MPGEDERLKTAPGCAEAKYKEAQREFARAGELYISGSMTQEEYLISMIQAMEAWKAWGPRVPPRKPDPTDQEWIRALFTEVDELRVEARRAEVRAREALCAFHRHEISEMDLGKVWRRWDHADNAVRFAHELLGEYSSELWDRWTEELKGKDNASTYQGGGSAGP